MNQEEMKEYMEAEVWVKRPTLDSGWICTVCPKCGVTVRRKDGSDVVHYCFNCGQHLKFNDFRKIMDNHSGLTLEADWKRCIVTDEIRKAHIENVLKKAEHEICVKDSPMVRIMRDMYIKTLFESSKEV